MSTLYKILATLLFVTVLILIGVGYVWYSIAFPKESPNTVSDLARLPASTGIL